MASAKDDSADLVVSKFELKEFQEDYYNATDGRYNWQLQVPHLLKLADGYLERYETAADSERDWTDLLKAHALYNSVAVRSPKNDDCWTRKVFEVQKCFLKSDASFEYEKQQSDAITMISKHLQVTRDLCRKEVKTIERISSKIQKCEIWDRNLFNKFYLLVSKLSLLCTDHMITLTKMIFEACLEGIEREAPCSFCVIALGSLAKGEATPYSDLEYFFIIEERNEQTIKYFEQLAMSSYFLIGNLRETRLESMAIAELEGWFQDKQKNGFKIDGLKEKAGNIPTGNGSNNSKNHFIFTPSELQEKYTDVFDSPELEVAKHGDFSAMLHYTRLLYCSDEKAEGFLNDFNKLMKHGQPNRNMDRKAANLYMFKADAIKYGNKPTEELINKGFSMNTKHELYRYPSLLLFNISILFGVTESNSWDTLQSLKSRNVISTSIHNSICFLLACSCYFRLSTYLFYDSQDDRLSVLPLMNFQAHENDSLPTISEEAGKRWYLPQKLFNKYCEFSVPLKCHIQRVGAIEVDTVLTTEISHPPSWLVEFQTYHYCNRWSESHEHFKKYITEEFLMQKPEETVAKIRTEFPEDFQMFWNSVKALTYALGQCRHDNVALSYNETVQRIIDNLGCHEDNKIMQLIMADVKGEVGDSCFALYRYEDARRAYTESLEILNSYLKSDDNQEILAKRHCKLAKCFNMIYRCDEAEEQVQLALQICYDNSLGKGIEIIHQRDVPFASTDLQLKYFVNPTIILAHTIWAAGFSYFYTKRYERAFQYFTRSYAMFLELYGKDACHRDIANILYAIGIASDSILKGTDFSTYFLKSLTMSLQLYDCPNAKMLLKTACSIGRIGYTMFFELVILKVSGIPRFDVPHSQSAFVLTNFALNMTYNGHYNQAKRVFKIALDIFEKVVDQDKYCRCYVANSQAGLGLLKWKRQKYDSAERQYSKALDTLKHKGDICSLLQAVEILLALGDMFRETQQHDKAREGYLEAESKQLLGSSDINHPQLLKIRNRLLVGDC